MNNIISLFNKRKDKKEEKKKDPPNSDEVHVLTEEDLDNLKKEIQKLKEERDLEAQEKAKLEAVKDPENDFEDLMKENERKKKKIEAQRQKQNQLVKSRFGLKKKD